MFIPAMIAVLLAEFGGRAALLPELRMRSLAAMLLGIAVGAAAFAGFSLSATMNSHARSLLLGIAFILTGFNQFGKAAPSDTPRTRLGTLIFVARSGAPFLAFAFSVWRETPIGAAAGALAGVAGAIALGVAPIPPGMVAWLRRCAGVVLVATGIYAALWALRFIA